MNGTAPPHAGATGRTVSHVPFVTLLGISYFTAVVFLNPFSYDSLAVVVSLFILLPAGLILYGYELVTRPFDAIDPIHVLSLFLLTLFIGDLCLNPGTSPVLYSDDEMAFCVACLSLAALQLSYRTVWIPAVSRRLATPQILRYVPTGREWWVVLLLWTVTFVFRLHFFLGRGFGTAFSLSPTSEGYANLVLLVGQMGAVLLLIAFDLLLRSRSSRSRIAVFLFASAIEVTVTSVAGWKSSPMFLVLALFLYIHHRTTDLRKAATALLVLAVLLIPFLFAVFQIVDTYRVRPGYVDPSVGDLLDTARSMDYAASGRDSTRVMRRLALGSMLSTAVGAVDSGLIDPQNGRTLWPAFVWFVPRALWRDKPTLSTGGWFARDALGWAPDAGEAAITLPGDLYLNFGIAAVVVGMFLYGFMLKACPPLPCGEPRCDRRHLGSHPDLPLHGPRVRAKLRRPSAGRASTC